MSKIDFYILADNGPRAREQFACRLIEKAYRLKNKIYVNVDSPEAADQIDDLLWIFRDDSFIPHELYSQHSGDSPVVIGNNVSPAFKFDLLINLATQVPDFYHQYPRVAEIVAGDDAHRQQARLHYKHYRDQGNETESHQL